MPRSRSSASESRYRCEPMDAAESSVVLDRKESVSVVLPWSMCASTVKRKGGEVQVEGGKDEGRSRARREPREGGAGGAGEDMGGGGGRRKGGWEGKRQA